MPLFNPTGSGGGATSITWSALANLGVGVSFLGAPFLASCDCGMDGTTLVFRGGLACSSNGTGFRMFDLPVAIDPPGATRRLNVQAAANDTVGLNLKTDRTVELSGTSGTFAILDGCQVPGWS